MVWELSRDRAIFTVMRSSEYPVKGGMRNAQKLIIPSARTDLACFDSSLPPMSLFMT
jgi:hypothetical protein